MPEPDDGDRGSLWNTRVLLCNVTDHLSEFNCKQQRVPCPECKNWVQWQMTTINTHGLSP